MKKLFLEITVSVIFVVTLTLFFYKQLSLITAFWNAQFAWSVALLICWVTVSLGYYHQGWLVRKEKQSRNVSLLLPTTVFLVQCILFVKGIYYDDWSLIIGAVLVNSGVVFNLYQIIRSRKYHL